MTCFECGEPAEEMHHVVPKSLGGTKMVPLCSKCHGLCHGMAGRDGHRELTKLGLQRAKERGVVLGKAGPTNLKQNTEQRQEAANQFAANLSHTLNGMKARGLSQRKIVDALNTSNIPTPTGKGQWGLIQLQRIMKLLKELEV